jgi:hypothetical protein
MAGDIKKRVVVLKHWVGVADVRPPRRCACEAMLIVLEMRVS